MIRAREVTVECLNGRQILLLGIDLRLIHMFVVEKEKGFVFPDRSAYPEPWILALKKRIQIERVSRQSRISSQIVIPVIVISAGMEIVTARPRHDVDGADGRDAGSIVEIHRGHLEFLNHLLREVNRDRSRARLHFIVDVTAVNREQRSATHTQRGYSQLRIELRGGAGPDGHPRLEARQLQKVAAV